MSLRLEDFAVYLPTEVISLYERLGITELYGWQAECLRTGVLDGSHLIYAAPTSGGKTLIAEIIILKKVIQNRLRLKSLFVLPYVSLVEEKHKHFARIARAYNRNQDLSDKIRVEAFFGDKPIPKGTSMREKTERSAVNHVVQGSCSDLIKTTMVNIDKELKARAYSQVNSPKYRSIHKSPGLRREAKNNYIPTKSKNKNLLLQANIHQDSQDDIYLVMQLHDELIFEVKEERAKEMTDDRNHTRGI